MRSFETRGESTRTNEETLGFCNGLGILMRERRRAFRPERFESATGGKIERRHVRVTGGVAAFANGPAKS